MLVISALAFFAMAQASALRPDEAAEAAAHDCRPVGEVIHCFNPPPLQAISRAELERLTQEPFEQERRIRAPLANGRSPEVCLQVQRRAIEEHRSDIAMAVDYMCNPQKLAGENRQ